jgi:hypothetical protein
MVNKYNQVVCDQTKIILNDGKTLFPGYIEIKDNKLVGWDSNDPMNEEAKRKPWVLHNRVEYKFEVESENCNDPKLQGKHFMSRIALERYLSDNP